jgi:membrane protein YqaA with SNARE-associated domain
MTDLTAYLGLFVTAFVAATIMPFLPGSSEIALGGLLALDTADPALLVAVATVGNVLGAVVNYAIGRYVHGLSDRPWFPVPPQTMARYERAFQRYGVWTLLLSWMPVLGDVITTLAGLLRTDLKQFLVLVTISKACRYLAILGGVSWFQA